MRFDFLWVALGGAAGALLRWAVGLRFPVGAVWPTLAVNVVGALVLGLILGSAAQNIAWVRPFVVVGVLGGFTTFSAFSGEVMQLIASGQWPLALGYAVGSVVAGVVAVAVGMTMGKMM